jgi:hypothetical protein
LSCAGESFDDKNFAQWYSCPGAIIPTGESCSDENNWGGSDLLERSRGLWYFVGVRDDGTTVMGTSEIIQLDRMGSQ